MTDHNPTPGNAPGLSSIGQLCDDANAAMEEIALFVSTVNASGEPWTPPRMVQLKALQDAHSEAVARMHAHPDAHLVETREGPVVGARRQK